MPEIVIIPASLRQASSSRATARTLADRLKTRANCTIAEIGNLPH